MREAYPLMAETLCKYCTHKTPQMPSLVLSPFLMGDFFCVCQLITWFTLQGVEHTELSVNIMTKTTRLEIGWHKTTFAGQADKSVCLRFPPAALPTHKEIAELRRVKLSNDSGFSADQWVAVYISL